MVRQSSIEAFKHIKENGLLSARRFNVYEFIVLHGPCTFKQIDMALRQPTITSGSYSGRLSELRRMGLIKEVGTTKCPVSGNTVILWEATDRTDPLEIGTAEKEGKGPTKAQLKDMLKEARNELSACGLLHMDMIKQINELIGVY